MMNKFGEQASGGNEPVPAAAGEQHEKDETIKALELLWRVSVLAALSNEGRRLLAGGDTSMLANIPTTDKIILNDSGGQEDQAPSIKFIIKDDETSGRVDVQNIEIEWLQQAKHGGVIRVVADIERKDMEYTYVSEGSSRRLMTAADAHVALSQIRRSSGMTPEQFDAYNPFL